MINPLLLTDLPSDVQNYIANYLGITGLNSCMRVSKLWEQLFQSDTMWEPIAQKLNIKKKEKSLVHQFVINSLILNWLPRNLGYLQNEYKTLVRQKLLEEDEKNEAEFPEVIVKLLGGSDAFRRLPLLQLPLIHITGGIIGIEMKEEYFSAPVVRAIHKYENEEQDPECYILFRIKNNITGEVHCEGLNLYFDNEVLAWSSPLMLEVHPLQNKKKILFKGICYPPDDNSLDRLQRIIQRKPVGLIIDKINNQYIEGPSTTSNGKSVLELC